MLFNSPSSRRAPPRLRPSIRASRRLPRPSPPKRTSQTAGSPIGKILAWCRRLARRTHPLRHHQGRNPPLRPLRRRSIAHPPRRRSHAPPRHPLSAPRRRLVRPRGVAIGFHPASRVTPSLSRKSPLRSGHCALPIILLAIIQMGGGMNTAPSFSCSSEPVVHLFNVIAGALAIPATCAMSPASSASISASAG